MSTDSIAMSIIDRWIDSLLMNKALEDTPEIDEITDCYIKILGFLREEIQEATNDSDR